jgi:hypothetical protein
VSIASYLQRTCLGTASMVGGDDNQSSLAFSILGKQRGSNVVGTRAARSQMLAVTKQNPDQRRRNTLRSGSRISITRNERCYRRWYAMNNSRHYMSTLHYCRTESLSVYVVRNEGPIIRSISLNSKFIGRSVMIHRHFALHPTQGRRSEPGFSARTNPDTSHGG